METLWKFNKNLKIEIPCDPAIPLLDVYPKEMKRGHQRDLHSMFIETLFTIAKI